MDHKEGGGSEVSVTDRRRDFTEETDFPVIELIDVVEEDSDRAALSAGPDDSILEKDIDAALSEDPPDSEAPGAGHGLGNATDELELPPEDFSGFPVNGEEDFKFDADAGAAGSAGFKEAVSLDMQRLELMISRIVEDAVTRVTRETVAQVTEKVLTAAIEAIRDNLEDPTKR